MDELRGTTGTWVLEWFDSKTDELVREMHLTDDLRYGEMPIIVPEGQECFVGFVTDVVAPGQQDGSDG